MLNDPAVAPLPTIFVGKNVINRRVTLFMQKKHQLLTEAMNRNGFPQQETRSVWYSKQHVETWLDEMKLMNADGMRIYFGAYAEEDVETAGQLCLLMVLTRSMNNGTMHKDIVLEDEPNFTLRGIDDSTRGIFTDPENGEEKPREYNYGSPCPPVCPNGEQAFPQ